MDPDALTRDVSILWIWIAAPLALLAALVATVALRVPQITRLREAFRGLRAHDPTAKGTVPPASSAALSFVATYGAAGAVGAATAVSLGGAGAVAWIWLFAILLAPLRMAEALLARTAPPGQAKAAHRRPGSLASRMLEEPSLLLRGLGWALLLLVPLAGFAFYGGTHGEAVADAADRLLPGSALALGLVVAGAGALFALVPLRRAGSILGWIGAVALLALFAAALVAFLSEPGRAFGGFGRALMDALYDAPSVSAFAGATAGEIAFAAILHLLPPVAAPGGLDGALHAEAQAETTKRQAATALLGPIAYGVLGTLLGLSFVATGAFARRAEGERPLSELTSYRVGFETVSQRRERDRRFTGILRVTDGSIGVVENGLATDRGMVREPRFVDRDEPADIMLRYRVGLVQELQRRGSVGALEHQPLEDVRSIVVRGRMLPRGGALVAESMTRGAGSVMARVALAALLVLAALGAAAWGLGIARTLRARVPENVARWAVLIPALGLALGALGFIPRFGLFGTAIAALLTIVSSLALALRAGHAARLMK